jgi:hypothetical protein
MQQQKCFVFFCGLPTKKQIVDKNDTVDFLVPILPHLTWATPPHSGFIVFSPSAAGVAIPTRFGLFFPINMFAIIDDFTAELSSCRSLLSNSVHHPEPSTIANLLRSIRSADGDINHSRRYDKYQSNLLTDEPLEDPILRNPAPAQFIGFSQQLDTPLLSIVEPIANRHCLESFCRIEISSDLYVLPSDSSLNQTKPTLVSFLTPTLRLTSTSNALSSLQPTP